MQTPATGLVGLGAMGAGIAATLRRRGYVLRVCDAMPQRAQAFAADGGIACDTPAQAASGCDVLVSVVVDAAQTEQVLFGEHGAAAVLAPGSVFVMCSTVDPRASMALEARLAERGILYLDAPISGGAARAASGQMTMMTSGTPAAYERAGAVLDAMAGQVYRLGDRAGAGSTVKVINQLLAGVHIAAAAEAMALGLRQGVDAAALYEVITHSAGNSWMFENRMAHVLAGDYTPLSAVDIFVKDLGLVLDMARASKFPLPLSSTAHQMFMQASSAGFAREDDSAVIKIFPGITLPSSPAKPQEPHPMNLLITGGCGFLGARLARTLLQHGLPALAGTPASPIDRLLLADRVPPAADLAGDARVQFIQGDLGELIAAGRLPLVDVQGVFHLAAAVSGECEADFDLGMRSNLDATRSLLDACRRAGHAPMFVFSSSVAVFGSAAGQPLPAVVDDRTLPTPQSSYGIQKFIGEQLVADYTRKGFVQGRSVRLMTVSVRPGRPNGAASSFLSGLLREPLAGVRTACPVAPDTPVALASPGNTVRGLLRAAAASRDEWGPRTAVNLPALTTTVREMAQALERLAGPAATALIDWSPDAAVAAIVGSWPSRVQADRAQALGLAADADFDAILREYVRENPQAVTLPLKG